jgi:hypothetical protein
MGTLKRSAEHTQHPRVQRAVCRSASLCYVNFHGLNGYKG